VMSVLAESTLAGPEELQIITSAWVDPLEVAEQTRAELDQQTHPGRVDEGPEPGDNESTTKDEVRRR
jgi:hypothetical protein